MNRDEFMELVYETFADEPDNVLANGIIEAADAYAEHEKAQLSQEGTTSDTISRQAAIDALDCINGTEEVLRSLPPAQPEYRLDEWCMDCKEYDQKKHCCPRFNRVIREAAEEVRQNAQLEPAIPLSWIENEIKWLKSLDNTFSEITALQFSAMVKKWRDEQDETD